MNRPVSIVVPSWNGRQVLERNLPSLEIALEAYPGGGEILVVDDGSVDGTVEWAASAHPAARRIRQDTNQGFVAAVGAGVSAARHDHILLLNNDMRVEPDFLEPLLSPFDGAAGLFATTPRIVNRTFGGDEGVTACTVRFGLIETLFPERGAGSRDPASHDRDPAMGSAPEDFPRAGTAGDDLARSGLGLHAAAEHDVERARCPRSAEGAASPKEVLFACGGAAAIDRALWKAMGGLDPLFAPFYWEDVDLSWRARKRGWRILHVPASVVHHEHSATIGARFDPVFVSSIYERNRLLFHWKNLTSAPMMARHLLWLCPRLLRALAGRPTFLRGFAMAIGRAPAVLRARRIERAEATVSDEAILDRFRLVGPGPVLPAPGRAARRPDARAIVQRVRGRGE